MVNSLQNKNRTDLTIITVKTSKGSLDQFVIFARLIFSGNKKELSQKKIKNNVKNNTEK